MHTPKLKDIADATGLHEMTISRALRNTGRMRPSTRQRILDAARELGYRPHAAAAAMRTGHTGCIVLLSSSAHPASTLPPTAISAIVEAVTRQGGYLAHAAIPPDADFSDSLTLPRLLGRDMAEGLLLDDLPVDSDSFNRFLKRHKIPAIWMNQKRSTNAIYPDDAGAALRVTERLLSLGHRRIALVRMMPPETTAAASSDSWTDTFNGYSTAMKQAGLRTNLLSFPVTCLDVAAPFEIRLQPLADAFADPDQAPTAVMAYRYGSTLMSLMLKLGLRVPEDVSLVSFTTCSSQPVERLASWVQIPCEEMGRKAVEMLYRAIDDQWLEMPAVSLPYGEIASLHTLQRSG